MYIGPIHPTLPGLSTGHNPIKPIIVSSSTGRQTVLFDSTYSYPLQQDQPLSIDLATIVWESTQAAAIAKITQIIELIRNTEWQRCGIFIQWREDGVTDPEDGWYNLAGQSVDEALIVSGYAKPQISFEQRSTQRASIGIFVDSKLVPNDAGATGLSLAAIPVGISPQYPVATWSFTGAGGPIAVIESPISVLRGSLLQPLNVMNLGRCKVTDEV